MGDKEIFSPTSKYSNRKDPHLGIVGGLLLMRSYNIGIRVVCFLGRTLISEDCYLWDPRSHQSLKMLVLVKKGWIVITHYKSHIAKLRFGFIGL